MKRRGNLLLIVIAMLPPLAAFTWITLAAVNAPDAQTWGHLWSDDALRTATGHRLSFAGEPRFVTFRLAYHGLLAIPGVDFARLAWVGYGIALLTGLLAAARAGWSRPWVAVGLALLLFSPAFGADWLQGERARFMLPGLAFAAAALLLTRDGRLFPRLLGAAILSALALTTTSQGILVWFALIPLVAAAAARRATARPGVTVAVWIVAGNLTAILTYHRAAGWATASESPLIQAILHQPGAAAAALLHAIGAALPGAGALPTGACIGVGLALTAATATALLAILARRGNAVRRRRTMPWIACVILGLGQAAFAVDALGTGLAEAGLPEAGAVRELAWPVSWLAVGAVGLFATAVGRISRAFTAAACVFLALVLAADWAFGLRHLENRARELCGGEAQLPFFAALGDVALADPGPPIPLRLGYEVLRARGLLRRTAPVGSLEIATFAPIPIATWSASGVLDAITATGDHAFEARGEVCRGWTTAAPDLVLLTHGTATAPELVFRLVRPRLGPSYGRLPWWATFPNLGFRDGDTIRAWGYFVRTGKVWELHGAMRYTTARGFQPEEATQP